MATALQEYDISDICANCLLFNWNQPENPNVLRKCTRCHAVAYCGRECQEEHWHKVHKKQCKYLGGTKKAQHSEHKKETCKTCVASDSVGDLVFSPTNPNYFCIFEHVDWSLLPPNFPHPFPLNGPPEDRIEKMLNAAQKILLKIKVTENPVYLLQPQQVERLEKDLWTLRGRIYFIRICGGDRDPLRIFCSMEKVVDVSPTSPWRAIVEKAGYYFYQMHGGELLATLALLIQLTRATTFLGIEKSLKSSNSLPREFRQMSKTDQFFEVTDKIMEALDQQVVPFRDLAVIACGGKTQQNCSQCNKPVIVKGISLEDLSVTLRASAAEIVFNPIETERYICESSECYKKERLGKDKKYTSWLMAVMSTHSRLHATSCNHCFLLAPLNEVHRSKCLTKNYCSQVCRDADDAAHKVCCDPDEEQRRIEERKVKIGGRDKVEAANAQVDAFGKHMTPSLAPYPEFAEEVMGKIKKKTKPREKLAKEKKETQIDDVD